MDMVITSYPRGRSYARHRLLPSLSVVLESHDASANRNYCTPVSCYDKMLNFSDSDTVTGRRLMVFECIVSRLPWL